MTELCSIPFQNVAAVEILEPELSSGDHDTHTHTLRLFRKLPEETVRKKRTFQSEHTL